MSGRLLISVLGLVLILSVLVFLGSGWFARKFVQTNHVAMLSVKWPQTILQTLYFVGAPYLALITGLLPARFLGLKGSEFFTMPNLNQSLPRIISTLLTQVGNVLLTWMSDFSLMATTGALLGTIFVLYLWVYLQVIKPNLEQSEIIIYQSTLEIIFDVAHWAFYRAVIWLISGSIYLGVLGGGLLVMMEYTLSSRFGKFSNLAQQQYLFRFSLGLVTSMAFLITPNLWLIVIFHLALAIISKGLFRIVETAKTNSI